MEEKWGREEGVSVVMELHFDNQSNHLLIYVIHLSLINFHVIDCIPFNPPSGLVILFQHFSGGLSLSEAVNDTVFKKLPGT